MMQAFTVVYLTLVAVGTRYGQGLKIKDWQPEWFDPGFKVKIKLRILEKVTNSNCSTFSPFKLSTTSAFTSSRSQSCSSTFACHRFRFSRSLYGELSSFLLRFLLPVSWSSSYNAFLFPNSGT